MRHVGDAVELTFNTTTGATVVVTVTDPSGVVVADAVAVAEASPGVYAYTFLLSEPGVWSALFRASGTVTAVEPFYVRAVPVDGPPPLATVGEVAEGLGGTLTLDQERLAAGLLRRASAKVRADPRVRDFADRIAAGTLDPNAPGEAVLSMVLRVMRNPAGLRSEAAGPFSRSYDLEAASALLEITDAEMDLLLPGWNTEAWSIGSTTTVPRLMGYEPWPERRPPECYDRRLDRWGPRC